MIILHLTMPEGEIHLVSAAVTNILYFALAHGL